MSYRVFVCEFCQKEERETSRFGMEGPKDWGKINYDIVSMSGNSTGRKFSRGEVCNNCIDHIHKGFCNVVQEISTETVTTSNETW
jgi:hypothetical protein